MIAGWKCAGLVIAATLTIPALSRAADSKAPTAKPDGRVPRYAPAPAWIVAPPIASDAPVAPGVPARVVYLDQQVRIVPDGEDTYLAYRIKVLAPEALGVGNIAVGWAPDGDRVVIHRLAIIRDGRPIDVLATQKFAVIQRENNLEQSMLDGNLTATLQVAGLQVGDELEFAMSKLSRDPTGIERPQGFMQFPLIGARGGYRLRIVQPAGGVVAYRASADLPPGKTIAIGAESDYRYEMSDPASAILPENAPPRYSVARLAQYSGYATWPAVSGAFASLYVAAATLPAGSPVRAEAARIAAETRDPVARAEAALRVVQDRIRYVYVGMNGGNYRPASADETWRRRFGDCKGKTVVLVALLRELGIAAEPALVATNGGDGTDARLPTPGVFDHVVVRATIDGTTHWLDGTRLGDRRLAALEPPPYRWALPLRPGGAPLEPIAPRPPRRPTRIEVLEIDASAGFDKPGRYRAQHTLRGDEIFGIRAQLAGQAPADADRMLAGYWRQQVSDVEPTKTTWRFDDANRLLVLAMEGEGKVDWDGDADKGRTHYLFAGGFTPPNPFKRPKDQDQQAPWANDYPAFSCHAAIVHVPAAGKGRHWSWLSKPVDRTLGGIAYWRIASFGDGVMRLARSRHVDRPEIDAAEAKLVNAALPAFDNNKSYVFEVAGKAPSPAKPAPTATEFGSFEDFAGPNPPCQAR